ncbi:MAG: binary toxin-like calcium binding domain-containing protein [Verrucomicrobiota bacterium]
MAAGLSTGALAANIAPSGTGVLGINDAIDADGGTQRYNAGTAAAINDNDPTTRVDNWFGTAPTDQGQAFSFVAIQWPSARFETIKSLRLTMATFLDGGWFGAKGVGPAAGGPLSAAQLIVPTVQVSTNAGATWTSAPATSDYLTALTGHVIGGGDAGNPTTVTATFTLQTPATRISGIRIIGENGGAADGNGFIGVFELEVEADAAVDSDGDGMADAWEQAYGLAVGTNDSTVDADNDGLTNLEEFNTTTIPSNPDTDGDGLKDGAEVKTHLTKPGVADTDGDGVSDGIEVNQTKTDPLATDSDQDGLSDGTEVNSLHTNPTAADTDGDSFSDSVEVAQGSDPLSPTSIPANVALFGHGLMGTKESLESGPETETEFYHVGAAENINDGDPATRVDTYNGDTPGNVSFVGILWDSPVKVARLELTFATFYDGGWFGVNGIGPGSGGKLGPSHLVEPRVEISKDGGASWTATPHSSDYLTALNGHGIGGGANPNPSSVKAIFTLNQPAQGITGIRIIGTDGGQASGGFLGVFELAALSEAPSATDTDSDGMEDAWERQHSLNVGVNDASGDPDDDGLTNKQEFTLLTDPQFGDTDNDGLSDGQEVNQSKTNPRQADTDGDGLPDGQEVNVVKSDPNKVDTDGDGYSDPAEVNLGSNPSSAASTPTDIALLGTGILGTKESVETGAETPVFNAGAAANINDGNLNTRVDTWNSGGADTASFVGILWPQPVTKSIIRLELSLAVFFDGGWFGVNSEGPGTGGVLSPGDYLVEPIVQVSTNGGTSWSTVAATSDYLTALNQHPLPTVDFGDPTRATAKFTLAQPQTGINGIRLLGSEGGTASSGFLGVFELAVITDLASSSDLTLVNTGLQSGKIQFEFDTAAGKNYTVQFTTALGGGNWQTLSTVTGDGARKLASDTVAGAQRFYRVTSP